MDLNKMDYDTFIAGARPDFVKIAFLIQAFQKAQQQCKTSTPTNLHIVEPLGYLEFNYLVEGPQTVIHYFVMNTHGR